MIQIKQDGIRSAVGKMALAAASFSCARWMKPRVARFVLTYIKDGLDRGLRLLRILRCEGAHMLRRLLGLFFLSDAAGLRAAGVQCDPVLDA
ncbi:MAG: hypothetical protein EPO10_15515 [Reyranella sp.]|uniref:hypothetical protein n=1 Tax=Reyranella sp. TaxID=1929291 RepID=UPI00120E55AC|nr:hypothetical protein [Reyranella sp.]TAJ97937.1 MAG: hypothetical protein EPO41_00285 [Reyranella sp.]TBR27946.1 MAG: hypothetical protein EPO10_15515 [Reyranella sp.]